MKPTKLTPIVLALVCACAQASPFGSPSPLPNGKLLIPGGNTALPTIVQNPPVVLKAQRMIEQATAEQASGAKVVTLTWHEHETFPIPIKPGMFTTLSFPKDEPVQQFAVSNPAAVQLQVNAAANVAMLKLVQPMTVAATVVTTKHIYYLQISPGSETWYQGVSWSFDAQNGFGSSDFGGGLYQAPTVAQAAGDQSSGASAGPILYAGDPNFNYKVTGKAPFAPTAVWDNGHFTWVQFANNVQELPALFADGPNGLEIVNYTVHNHGTQLLVNRLMPSFVLKLGKAEVKVQAESH